MKIETIRIKSDDHPSGYITVNKDDAHKYEAEKPKPKPTARTASKKDA